ncbi:ABC-type polysaccharide/polyol phosphate export systems, permease component [Pelotomaculum thermopropionicum SI]|uniref:Transport permease protein n=1 Tax=Pelotomaculum thermopropionicum (strain DSM 13744 / JCM 10971 / SI) TaxID=370438 RepID=A5D480_PELTS|nr:ABC-type polysaccharide/polyol phosphate export systems, permease component [Pelotomaculum thermopropionicum SI]
MAALKVIYTIWLREFKTFIRERSRIVGMIGQPLLYLLIVGKGITSGMSLNNAPGGMDYLKFMYPGIIGMSVLFTSIFSAVSIIWDREFGFLKEVLVAPVPRWAVAVGKILGGSTVSTIQSVILIALAPFAGISFSFIMVAELLLLAFLMSFAVTGFGVMIAARMESMQGFQMIMNFLVMPLYFLSGGMFPISTAPAWMKTLMVIDPLTYGVDAIRSVVFSKTLIYTGPGIQVPLVEVARQAGLVCWNLGLDIGVMTAFALGLAFLGSLSFSRAE